MNLEVVDALSESDKSRIIEGLKQYNTPHLNRARWGELLLVLRDDHNGIQGGLIGYQEENWIFIKYLWIDDAFRSKGWGARLLREFEEAAKRKGALHSMVETLSFQARPFYEKHGYECRMTLEDCPNIGTQCFFMTKSLS